MLAILFVAAALCLPQVQIDNEIPHGVIDGAGTLFTLTFTPNPISSLHLYLNGLRQQPNTDFFIGENRIHFVQAPQVGSKLLADYRRQAPLSIPVFVDGTPIGSASGINIQSGFGLLPAVQINNGIANLQAMIDTGVIASKVSQQSATNPQICTSSSANGSAYTASCATILTAITARQVLYWYPDITNTGGETLSIDTLPAVPLVDANGNALASGVLGTRLYIIWFDGTNFRVMI